MTSVLATSADAGRPCPYCHFTIKEGAAAERCDSCNSLHHADCWSDCGGCAMHGCMMGHVPPGAPTVPGATVASQLPPTQLYAGPAPPGSPPPAQSPYSSRGVSPAILAIAALISLLGIGAGVIVATGALSGGAAHASPRVQTIASTTTTQAAPAAPTGAEQHGDRVAIMALLSSYQSSYSAHDLDGLASIFSPGVTRHGLARGGCTVSHGRDAVLENYRSQFEEGSGSYRLIDLSEEQIRVDSRTRARLDTHYLISPGGTGYVNFQFADLGEGWKISEVYATCE